MKQCSKQFYLAVYCEKFITCASIPAEIDFMTDFLAEGCVATIDKWLIGDGGLSKYLSMPYAGLFYARKMKKYLRWELILPDDFLLHTVTDEHEIKILFELLEKTE